MTLSAAAAPPPPWPHCGGTCPGIRVAGYARCLAHLSPVDLGVYLAGLSAGASVDHRSTLFTEALLQALLGAVRDPATGSPRLGEAQFDDAVFLADAVFDGVRFDGDAVFDGAVFSGDTGFQGTSFRGVAAFDDARFSGITRFDDATFAGDAWFRGATFSGAARFDNARFRGDAWFDDSAFAGIAELPRAVFFGMVRFDGAEFSALVRFDGGTFTGDAMFHSTRFSGDAGFRGVRFIGVAGFDGARFTGAAGFDGATFTGTAGFDDAEFARIAAFRGVVFSSDSWFGHAAFSADAFFTGAAFANAWFGDALFSGDAWFDDAEFTGTAGYEGAEFAGLAWFRSVGFAGSARFDRTRFAGDAWFEGARFASTPRLGALVCGRRLVLSRAVFAAPVTIEAAASSVECVRTRWDSTATLRLRYAEVDLTDAVLTLPVAVATHPAAFTDDRGNPVPEPGRTGDPGIRVLSLRGVDATHLVLTDSDLTCCRFTGAFHLDQLRLEGETTFAVPPAGWRLRRGVPVRHSRRRTLAEEHHWRCRAPGSPSPPHGWTPGSVLPGPRHGPSPNDVAPVYRALRKASEDAKNEPDAADFYFGEMEMRRHDDRRPRGERVLLTAYWLLSGYGLRAARAFGWLLAAMAATVLTMVLWGLPDREPKPHTVGVQAAPGARVDLVTDKPSPVLTGSVGDRFTAQRAERAARVVVNSVVFRSSGQDLTTAGIYIEMASRFTEPILLALVVLAVRSRVKR